LSVLVSYTKKYLATLIHGKDPVFIMAQMSWATFWAIFFTNWFGLHFGRFFSQTHPVTLGLLYIGPINGKGAQVDEFAK
jgi:hypothetical protein